MFQLKNIKKTYYSKKAGDTKALDGIDLELPNKGLVFIVGESGSGKSTLLNVLGGLDGIDSGSILFNGKDIGAFNEEEMDSYRNTCVGFVFQDYNLLENYTVRENVMLSLNLQMIKQDNERVDNILNEVGLNGLGERKINELSGGQKQRVAIARALVKYPKIILADEPTGNLDSKTSKQIVELLKNISSNVLVVVVTHNLDAANTFGDRIIKISDGLVTQDSGTSFKSQKGDVIFKKSKLFTKDALKFCFSNIAKKKFRFSLTVILSMFAILFMIFTFNVFIFDINKYKLDALVDNEEYYINLKKADCKADSHYVYCNWEKIIDDELDILKFNNQYASGVIYDLIDTDNPLRFNLGTYQDVPNDFYGYREGTFFIKILDRDVLGELIGRAPNGNKEIVLSEVLADQILFRGIYDIDGVLYKPSSFEELVNCDKLFKLGDYEVKVVGISLVSNDDILKEMKSQNIVDPDLNYFFTDEEYATDYIYVDTFIDDIKLNYSEEDILKDFIIYNKRFHVKDYVYLDKEVSYYNFEGKQITDKLAYDEIILSIEHIVFNQEFEIEFNKYLKKYPDLSYNQVKFLFTEDVVVGNHNYKNLVTSFSNTNINFLDEYHVDNFKIVGITPDEKTYFSSELNNYIQDPTKNIYGVRIFSKNIRDLKKVINDYKDIQELDSVGEHYAIEYRYMSSINQIRNIYNFLHNFVAFIAVIFILFMVLLIYNFILATVAASKKDIGILRAMGATKKDVNKIFGFETFILNLISWISAVILFIILVKIINVSHIFHISLEIILIDIRAIIFSFVFTLFISMLLSIISTSRVARIKPIDAILDKK